MQLIWREKQLAQTRARKSWMKGRDVFRVAETASKPNECNEEWEWAAYLLKFTNERSTKQKV